MIDFWEDNINMDFRYVGWGTCTGSIFLRIGAVGGPFCFMESVS
jgi:hypothetical protein